jgi:hypothetical protein
LVKEVGGMSITDCTGDAVVDWLHGCGGVSRGVYGSDYPIKRVVEFILEKVESGVGWGLAFLEGLPFGQIVGFHIAYGRIISVASVCSDVYDVGGTALGVPELNGS